MEKVINKSEFIAALVIDNSNLSSETVEEATRLLLDLMCDTLCADGRIEIRGFGSFNLHHRAPRLARNPKTGEQVQVNAKAIPYFKPGKALREQVNIFSNLSTSKTTHSKITNKNSKLKK